MPSIGNTIRQVPSETAFYKYPVYNNLYAFYPAAGNYVGNYYPGYMAGPQLPLEIIEYMETLPHVLRDFGKTIKAPIGSIDAPEIGYFRHIQVLKPTGIITDATFPTFGVIGDQVTPTSEDKYYNFYIRVSICGRGNPSVTGPVAGGSM